MKGCRKSGTFLKVLAWASLIFFSGCGIPNYLNLDREITIVPTQVDEKEIGVSLEISDEGLSKLATYQIVNGPSIKFFYVISTNPSVQSDPISSSNEINASQYKLSNVTTFFNVNYRGTSGNGLPWSPERSDQVSDASAPAFYLYSENDQNHRKFSRTREQITLLHEMEAGILVSTFSQSPGVLGTNASDYLFGTAPLMDTPIPHGSNYDFSLGIEGDGVGSQVVVFDDGTKTYLRSFKRNAFPAGSSTSELQLYHDEDPYFHGPVHDEIVNTSGNLYMHIWAAVHASEGNFTNIYWSALTYLGNITLF